jgi:hypothetical protein
MKDLFDLSDIPTMTSMIDALFSEMNIGLVVYQLQDPAASSSLQLVYANKQAGEYTALDFNPLIGQQLLAAFPMLANTGVPEQYAEVVKTGLACNLGAFEYAGTSPEKSYYALKAFPMPNNCVGVLFENITVRKHLEEMVKQQMEK